MARHRTRRDFTPANREISNLPCQETQSASGKRDGHLVVSFDKGADNWSDLTPVLPSPIKAFKDIVFVGSTMYVATDVGITASDNGKPWRVITDSESTNLVMEQLAVDGNTLYGVNKTGIYRLENGIWNQILSEMPDNIISLAVDGRHAIHRHKKTRVCFISTLTNSRNQYILPWTTELFSFPHFPQFRLLNSRTPSCRRPDTH